MSEVTLSVICCTDSPDRHSQISTLQRNPESFDELIIETVEQSLDPGVERDLHNAAHHSEHGPVTYLQQVHTGGFSVFTGPPDALTETFFGAGSWVAFIDDEGPGHGSKVGPDGVQRTMRVLRGHVE